MLYFFEGSPTAVRLRLQKVPFEGYLLPHRLLTRTLEPLTGDLGHLIYTEIQPHFAKTNLFLSSPAVCCLLGNEKWGVCTSTCMGIKGLCWSW